MSFTQVQVYHRAHRAYASETTFGEVLVQSLGALQINNSHPVSMNHLQHTIDTRRLHAQLAREDLLPERARTRCMDELSLLSDRVFAARGQSELTHDFVVETRDVTVVVEFHEVQHRRLTVKDPVPLYDDQGRRYLVSRSLQRLIRDVWRVDVVENLVIVWYDWFKQHGDSFRLPLTGGFHEYTVPGRFSLERFCRE